MGERNVSSGEWTELVPSNFEDDYSIVVEESPIYFTVGSKPATPVAGLPLREGAIYSGEVDRGEALWGRAQTDVDSSVRVVPGVRVDGSNERAVTVQSNVQTDTYDRGGDFDTATYPVEISPPETIQHVLLSIVEAEVEIEIETADGDVVTIPLNAAATIDSYQADAVTIRDPGNDTPRVAGGWAGE